MNSKHILDLTHRLSQALDQNYDVVNMGAVISVISALEGTTITREQLETTKLAKYINQLRRRTKSEHLARRAKSLLKKWREMVGIQQPHEPSSSNAATIINDNSIATSLHQPQLPQLTHQHHHRSQPTSPIIEMNLENVHVNPKSNINQTDFLRSTVSNPAPTVSSLTRSANLSIYNSNKRLENIECQSGGAAAASSSTVPTSGYGKQPTSFANLITSFGSSDNSISNSKKIANTSAGLHVTSPRVIRKSNKIPERDVKLRETFIIDQSSNSNSEFSYVPSIKSTCVAPIVINIQDSNSGSNLITSIVTNKLETEAPVSPPKVTTPLNSSVVTSFKSKKGKKEKRHKERETLNEIIPYSSTSLLVADESFSNQHRHTNNEDCRLAPAVDEKSRLKFPYNISEILSLSNSSMSSLFPTEGGTSKAISDKKTKVDINTSNRTLPTNLPTSDLTFAGKFKHHTSTMPSISSQSNTIGFSGSKTNFSGSKTNRVDSSNNVILGPPYPEKNVLNKFIPFSSSACNSNDSTSNSRTSQFDVIDVTSQEKKSNVYMQPKSTAENLLMPPSVSTTHLQQQKAETTGTNRSVIVQDKKIPKKRGRKKGSKGVDSVIAKETSLSSQMLISSLGGGGKKVKTTIEIFAEMQNRNLGISTNTSSPTMANWASHQQLSSRPESSCSEPSLHSPRTLDACSTNATMSTVATRSTPEKYLMNTYNDEGDSDSGTITSEPSRDSISAQKKIKKGASVDSNSNSQFSASKINEYRKPVNHANGTIEKQLLELLKQLPPVPNIANIEVECALDLVPCTCQIKEILPNVAETQGEDDSSSQNKPSNYYKTKVEAAEQQPVISVNVAEHGIDNSKITAPKSVPVKPKKSIFDLDFDDDEDPLHTFMAEAAATSAKSIMSTEQRDVEALEKEIVDSKSELVLSSNASPDAEFVHQNLSLEQMIPQPSLLQTIPIFLTYQAEEDPNCMAKQQFEIQTQKITKFHIDALHNCFIPNVNGNWDNADVANNRLLDSNIDIAANLPSDIYNVVPQYGSLINERLRKDLSHISFTKNFKPKKQSMVMEKIYSIPFLGVARRYLLQRKHRKHKQKKCNTGRTIVNDENKKTVDNNEELKLHIKCPTEFVNTCENKNNDIDKSVDHENIVDTLNSVTNKNILNMISSNNMLLNDITIDVPDSNVLDILSDDGRNLLAIANSSTETPPSDKLSPKDMYIIHADLSTLNENKSKANCPEDDNTIEIACSGSAIPTSKAIDTITEVMVKKSEESDPNTVAYFSKRIDNTSSRRSSSCSNSSLKQTQQSINLKLRRQRLLQQQQEQHILEGANGSKRRRKKTNRKHYSESDNGVQECKETRIVKRIKIAINGDVATQRQIFFGSNNNSTDEDCEGDSDGYAHDELIDNVDGSLNSAGSHNSTFEDDNFNINNNDDEANQIGDDNDEQETEEYEDADFYEDDEQSYSCDYHEVVTRDISATSTGNNHIVLTIKKTPSKTNSPSNSLSAMSPVINSSTYSSNNAIPVAPKTVEQNLIPDDNIYKIDGKCEQPEEKSNISLQCETINTSADNNEENKKQIQACANFPVVSLADNISNNILPILRPAYCLKNKRTQRKRLKAEKFKTYLFPNNDTEENTATTVNVEKLHKQLFFSYELSANMLNISSCSSSCTERENEREYESSSADDDSKNDHDESLSRMHQSLSNSICRKRNLSKSDCSSCDFSNPPQSRAASCVTNTSDNCEKDDEGKASFIYQHCEVNALELNLMKHDVKGDASDKINCDLNVGMGGKVKSEPSEELEQSTDQHQLPLENNGLLLSFNNIYYNIDEEEKPSPAHEIVKFNKVITVTDNDDGTIYDANVILRPAEEVEEKLKRQLQKKNCDDYNLYNNNNNFNLIKYDSNEPSLKNIDSFRNSCRHNSGINNYETNYVGYKKINATVKYDSNLPKTDNYIDDKKPTSSASCLTTIAPLASTPQPPTTKTPQHHMPHKEYRTGLRAVDEDVDDDDGNNCARIQQFKEWHQVLQLRSYNDEMLTVLPYVVLE